MTSLTTLRLGSNSIGGQGIGNIDALVNLTSVVSLSMSNNIGMSCTELTTLINVRGSPPVDTDNNGATANVAVPVPGNGANCTNP